MSNSLTENNLKLPQGVPRFTAKSELVDSKEEAEWANKLVHFLYHDILAPLRDPPLSLKPDQVAQLLSLKAMPLWLSTFTHISFDPNDGQNYEEMEKFGDPVMKTAFIMYVQRLYPDITAGQLASLTDYYLAKQFQSELSGQLHLPKYVRSIREMNISIQEDVLEAVYGALFNAARFFLSAVDTYKLIYQFLSKMFDRILTEKYGEVKVDENLFFGPATTQVKEIFEKMGWRYEKNTLTEIQEDSMESGGYNPFVTTLNFNPAFFEWLEAGGLKQYNRFLVENQLPPVELTVTRAQPQFARVASTTQRMAKKIAYVQGVDYLSQLGFGWPLVDAYQKSMPSADPELEVYDERLWQKLGDEDFQDYIWGKTLKGPSWRMLQLIGIRPPEEEGMRERKEILTTIYFNHRPDSGPRESELRQLAVLSYLDLGPNKDVHYHP